MKKWFKKKFLNIAVGVLANTLYKEAPIVAEGLDVSNEKSIIGMLRWFAEKTHWPYATGTAHDRILEIGNHLGDYGDLWRHFWTTLQKKIEKQRRKEKR